MEVGYRIPVRLHPDLEEEGHSDTIREACCHLVGDGSSRLHMDPTDTVKWEVSVP